MNDYLELTVKPGYYMWMVARDYLGDANRYTEIIRKRDMKPITDQSARTLQAGEIVLVPKSNNPKPEPSPNNPTILVNDTDPVPTIKSSSNNMLIYLGLGALIFFMMKGKKSNRRR